MVSSLAWTSRRNNGFLCWTWLIVIRTPFKTSGLLASWKMSCWPSRCRATVIHLHSQSRASTRKFSSIFLSLSMIRLKQLRFKRCMMQMRNMSEKKLFWTMKHTEKMFGNLSSTTEADMTAKEYSQRTFLRIQTSPTRSGSSTSLWSKISGSVSWMESIKRCSPTSLDSITPKVLPLLSNCVSNWNITNCIRRSASSSLIRKWEINLSQIDSSIWLGLQLLSISRQFKFLLLRHMIRDKLLHACKCQCQNPVWQCNPRP